MDRIASALDILIEKKVGEVQLGSFDTVVVGSGYGGAIAARELLRREEHASVLVLERGKEYLPGEFAQDIGHLPAMVRVVPPAGAKPVGYPDALFDFRLGDHVDVLQGSGLGGTSLINASVARRTQLAVFQGPRWPDAIRRMQTEEWESLYNRVERMLEVSRLRHDKESKAEHPRQKAFNRIKLHGAKAELVPLTVNFTGESACTHCGNCVAGCNVGAKRGVFHQLLQDADRKRLHVFTNALVKALSRTNDGQWNLAVRRTTSDRTPVENEEFTITARRVILAAGALGSTEILKRSELLVAPQKGRLRFSPRLGSNFSTNGDGLLFGFGQRNAVGASAAQSQREPTCKPGPTITNAVTASLPLPDSDASQVPVTIENCVVPYLLEDIYGEVVTTAAQLGRLGQTWLPALHADGARDPLRASPEAIAHTQALLVMGDDGANGELKWFHEDGDSHGRNLARGRIEPVWGDVARNPVLVAVDHFFRGTKEQAFDGGQYVPNPAWQLVPPEAAAVLSGALPEGRALTVHPLGGCGMGQDARLGVVNEFGQVFEWAGRNGGGSGVDHKAVYDGLYVLDGSILPTAVGTNPLLTISALVLRAMDKMLAPFGAPEVPGQYCIPEFPIRDFANPQRQVGNVVNFTFFEVMYEEAHKRKLIGLPIAKGIMGQHIGVVRNGARKLNMRDLVELQDYAIDAEFALKLNSYLPGFLDYSQGHSLSRQELSGLPDVQNTTGTVRFFPNPKKSGQFELKWRAILALLEYHRRRVPFPSYAWKRLLAIARGDKPGAGLFKEARSFWNVALQQAQYRSIEYEFNSAPMPSSKNGNLDVPFAGKKVFGFGRFNDRADRRARIWDVWIRSLFSSKKSGKAVKFTVDVNYKSVGFPYYLTGDANLVEGLVQIGRFSLLLMRNIFATSFWEFGAPDYEDLRIERDLSPRPLKIGADKKVIVPHIERLRVPLTENNRGTVDIELTHYSQPQGKPILLVHGLAQGSLIFTADNGANMASALFQAGFDVWLVDHRLSNRLIEDVALDDWSYEEIGQFDLSMAIEHIYRKTKMPVNVFAHCVGATAIEMGLLQGWIPHTMIDNLAINAIHPWVEPSPVNGFRAFFGAMLRGMTSIRYLDPLPSATPSVFETLLDRVVFSLARFEEESADAHYHKAKWVASAADVVCDRMSGLYGRMWRHENMTKELHADLVNLVGPAPISVYRHLYYFVMRRKITDREGRDIFLAPEQLKGWKCRTLFLHGADSHVFSPISAIRSAVNLRNERRSAMQESAENPEIETVFLKVVPEHGHMDVIFGAKAHREVFSKTLIPFFNNAVQAEFDSDDIQKAQDEYFGSFMDRASPGFPQCRKPTWDAGPILRRVTLNEDEIKFHFWVNVPRIGRHVYLNYSPEWLDSEIFKKLSDLKGAAPDLIPAVDENKLANPDEFPEYKVLTIRRRVKDIRDQMANKAFDYRDILKQVFNELEKLRLSPMAVVAAQPKISDIVSEIPDFVAAAAEKNAYEVPEWLRRIVDEREANQRFAFAIGSCRYPGSMLDSERSDAIFAIIGQHVAAKRGIDAVFFVGDQIYSDATASLLDPSVLRDKYIGSYEEAFISPAFRHLACRVPVHFAIDDHELADNWSGNANENEGKGRVQKMEYVRAREQFRYGRGAALAVYARRNKQDVLWYEIAKDESMPPCFVMDCRSERSLRKADNIFAANMISEEQLAALKNWLTAVSNDEVRKSMPKFIFSGGVLAPVSKTLANGMSGFSQEDGWLGYPKTTADVLTFIAEKGISGVVFVGGDLHFSAYARIDVTSGSGRVATVHQVMSSGLYVPLPFTSQPVREFSWCSQDTITLVNNGGLELKIESCMLCEKQSHFLRLDAWKADSSTGNAWEVSLQPVTADAQVVEPYKFRPFANKPVCKTVRAAEV